jgi:hypothetical protein
VKRDPSDLSALLARESACLARLETLLREEEERLAAGAPADAAAEVERGRLLPEIAQIRGAISAALTRASRAEELLARENRERASKLEERTRELLLRYESRREELTAALSETRRARSLVAELGARRSGGRLDLKR